MNSLAVCSLAAATLALLRRRISMMLQDNLNLFSKFCHLVVDDLVMDYSSTPTVEMGQVLSQLLTLQLAAPADDSFWPLALAPSGLLSGVGSSLRLFSTEVSGCGPTLVLASTETERTGEEAERARTQLKKDSTSRVRNVAALLVALLLRLSWKQQQ